MADKSSILHTVRVLWSRAALWRLVLLSAILSLLLFMFFPPVTNIHPLKPPPVIAEATYTPAPAENSTPPSPLPSSQPQTANLSLATPNDIANDAIRKETGLDTALLGRLYEGSVKVNGFDVPLPGKHWIILANMAANGPVVAGRTLLLGRVEHKNLVEVLQVFAIRPKIKDQASPFLSEQAVNFKGLFKSEEFNTLKPSMGWVIYDLSTSSWDKWGDHNFKMSNLVRAAVGDMIAKGISYPQNFITVEFMIADKAGYLEVIYYFNPEVKHTLISTISGNPDTKLEPANLDNYPEKVAYIKRIKLWGDSFWLRLKTVFATGL